MGFINPLLLWSLLGLAGVLLPILIHLLKRHQVVAWGAMEILQRILRKRRRRVRMEDLIVLVLRCLALLLLAMALLRPTLLGPSALWFMGEQRVGSLIAIDGSFSMRHGELTSRFDRAREHAKAVAATLGPEDFVTIVLLGNHPQILLRNAAFDLPSVNRILDETAASAERLNLEACLDELAVLMNDFETPVRECTIITDAQAATWDELSDAATGRLRELTQSEARTSRLYVIPVEAPSDENLALTSFDFADGTIRADAAATFAVRVLNAGNDVRRHIPVHLVVDGREVDTQVIQRLEPGRSAVAPLRAQWSEPGVHRLTAVLPGDAALAVDNARHAVVRVPKAVHALCVDGERPLRDALDSDTYFIRKALRLKGFGPAAGVHTRRVSETDLAPDSFDGVDLVILANLRRMAPATAAALRQAVERGTGLVVYTGSDTDGDKLNFALGGEVDLLPAETLDTVEMEPARAAVLRIADKGHPLGRLLSEMPERAVHSVRCWSYHRLRPRASARVVLKLSNGDPLLVERAVGKGRVLLMATSADRSWNDLALSPINPIWLHHMLSQLAENQHAIYRVGEEIRLEVDASAVSPVVNITAPGGALRRGNVRQQGERASVDLGLAAAPGFYEATLVPGEAPTLLAANVDTAESPVQPTGRVDLERRLTAVDAALVPPDADIAAILTERRTGRETWRALLLLSLLLFLLQAYLSDRFSGTAISSARRIHTGFASTGRWRKAS